MPAARRHDVSDLLRHDFHETVHLGGIIGVLDQG